MCIPFALILTILELLCDTDEDYENPYNKVVKNVIMIASRRSIQRSI